MTESNTVINIMNILIICSKLQIASNFADRCSEHNIGTHISTFNDVVGRSLSNEYTFSAIVYVLLTTADIKQYLLLQHQNVLEHDKVVIWGATKSIPQSLTKNTLCHLLLTKDFNQTVIHIKEKIVEQTLLRSGVPLATNLVYENLKLDRQYRQLVIDTKCQPLRNKEFALLELFMSHPQKLIDRTSLLETVWDINKRFDTNTLDVHIGKIRKVLGKKKDLIKTIHSVGYIFG